MQIETRMLANRAMARTTVLRGAVAAIFSLGTALAIAQGVPTPNRDITTPSTPMAATATTASSAAAGDFDMLVGTYTIGSDSKGIYVYRFDTATGKATLLSTAAAVNPSYLAIAKDLHHVYTVNELPGDATPNSSGSISAFTFDAQSGQLAFVDRVSSQGNDPTYLTISPDGKYLVTANYSVASNPGGSLTMFPITPTGAVGPAVLSVHHDGSGPVSGRQDNSHVHSTVFSPDGHYLFAQDLGVDKVFSYRYRADSSPAGTNDTPPLLAANTPAYTALPPGSGPRHLIFDQSAKHAYLTTEMNSSVTVFDYADGHLTHAQTVQMTAPGYKGAVGGGAIHLSADGRFLYTTNRGDVNQIVSYKVDPASGHLTLLQRISSEGKTPREFSIDPSGHWLIVGNQQSNTAFVFRRDPETGKLLGEPTQMDIGSPVYFAFVPAHS